MAGHIAVQITYSDNSNATQKILLTTIKDVTVSSSSSITTHPMVNGDIVADHMYKEPITMDIRGTFSINGGLQSEMTDVDSNAFLLNIQRSFEEIQQNGYLCDIVKLTLTSTSDNVRFLRRQNMILQSIDWTEKINALDFAFSFTEAMLAEVQTYVVESTEKYLPKLTTPPVLNFTDTLIDWKQIDSIVVAVSKEIGLVSTEFLNAVQSFTADGLVAIGVGAGVAAIIFVTVGSIPVAGWIAVGVAAVGVFAYGIIKSIIDIYDANKYTISQFKVYNNQKKTENEIIRFSNFIGSIHEQLEMLNTAIQCYQLGSNDEQQCMITINNNYYVFTFTKNNIDGAYALTVTDIEDSCLKKIDNCSTSPTTFNDCTTSNKIMTAGKNDDGPGVWLIRLPVEDTDIHDLSNYYLVVSNVDPEQYELAVADIIKNAVLR